MRHRFEHRRALAGPLLATALVAGCSDAARTCNDMGCISEMPNTRLVDDTGQPVLARGEQRTSQSPTPVSFDCTASLATPLPAGQVTCRNGLVSPVDYAYPGNTVELRFELADGSFSEWQQVELSYESQTDPDFNGPGCPCTSYTATATPLVVPASARIATADAP